MAIFLSFQKTFFAFGFTDSETRGFPHILYVNQYQLSIGILFEIDTKILFFLAFFFVLSLPEKTRYSPDIVLQKTFLYCMI